MRPFPLLLAAALVSCGAAGRPPTADPPVSEQAARLLSATNAARAQARDCPDGKHYLAAPALTYSALLAASAQGYADALAAQDDFPRDGVHTDAAGHTFAQRAAAAGYQPLPGRMYAVGENVQGGAATPEAAVQAWLLSPTHCPNLMDPDFSELGLGLTERADTTYGIYWVQNLGRR